MTRLLLSLSAAYAIGSIGYSDEPTQADYYTTTNLPSPESVVPEVSGLEMDDKGRLYVATRRGNIWRLDTPSAESGDMDWHLWAQGLHEPLGLSWQKGSLYCTQRPEVTQMTDKDGDGRADIFKTINADWGINGDYHEYAFGSTHDKEGNIWITLCLTGSGGYSSDFRGWCVRVTPGGEMIPTTSGIRSPGGIGFDLEGRAYYCDNQGLWNGSSSLKHLAPGSFQGNPTGFKAYDELDENLLGGKPVVPNSDSRMETERERIEQLCPPAVILPHGKVGQSPTGIIPFPADGSFGPFEGQLMVAEQTYSQVQRVFLEEVNGYMQGATFHFLDGFRSGNIALKLHDGALYTGGSNRGWGAKGGKVFAMERVNWNGKVPFEVKEMRAKPDGFELTFTQPVDPATAGDISSYSLETWTYVYKSGYGSPEVDQTTPAITNIAVAADGLSARLTVDKLIKGHVHALEMEGVTSAKDGLPLLNQVGYYTLNEIPSE